MAIVRICAAAAVVMALAGCATDEWPIGMKDAPQWAVDNVRAERQAAAMGGADMSFSTYQPAVALSGLSAAPATPGPNALSTLGDAYLPTPVRTRPAFCGAGIQVVPCE